MWAELIGHFDDPLAEFAEEMLIVGRLAAAPRAAGVESGPFGFVEENQVQVAVIVHLAAAEFAQRHDDELRHPSDVVRGGDQRLAELGDELGILVGRDPPQAGQRDVGERSRGGLDILLAEQIAHANAQLLRVLEAVQNRIHVFGGVGQIGEALFERFQRRQFVEHQTVHQLVEHPRMAGEDFGKKRAGRA